MTASRLLTIMMHYEFDVKRNPVILLRPLQDRVLVPQTKLSLLMIQWLARNSGLGGKVFSPFESDTQVFWNADPPSLDIGAPGSEFDMDASDVDEPQTIFDAFQDLPLAEWVQTSITGHMMHLSAPSYSVHTVVAVPSLPLVKYHSPSSRPRIFVHVYCRT